MQKGFAPILILIGILIIVAISGAYYLGTRKLSTIPVSSSTPEVTPQPQTSQATPSVSPISNKTTNWKIYTETTYKFLIKYPDGWIVTPFNYKNYPVASSDQQQLIVSFINKAFTGVELGTPGLIDITINYVKPKVSFVEFVSKEKNTESNNSINKPLSVSDDIVNIAGTQAHKIVYKYNDFTNSKVYVPKEDGSVYILTSQLLNKDSSLNAEFFDQILSTFEFTR